MSHNLPWTATRDDYEREAKALFDALQARENAALWNFKWMHPHYRGKTVTDVEPDKLDLDDARLVVAHEYFLQTWHNLMKFERSHKSNELRQSQAASRYPQVSPRHGDQQEYYRKNEKVVLSVAIVKRQSCESKSL